MSIDSRYDFFLDIIDTSMSTLLADHASMLITNDDYLYTSSEESIKLGYKLGKCKHNFTFASAARNDINETDSGQVFNIYITEEIANSTTATADLHKKVGYWQEKINLLLLNLGLNQTYVGGDGSDQYQVTIKNTIVDDDINFISVGNKTESPSCGLMFTAEFHYDQINY